MILTNIRVSFVNVVKPAPNLSGDLKYSVQVHIDKTDEKNLKVANAEIDKAIEKGKAGKWGGKKPKFRYEPLRDGDAELASGDQTDKVYAGIYFLSATMDPAYGRPGVVDENLNPVMDQDKIYSGCYCNVDLKAFPYDNSGNKGIGWGLSNIMFVRDGERLDGRQSAQDTFAHLKHEDTGEGNDGSDGAF